MIRRLATALSAIASLVALPRLSEPPTHGTVVVERFFAPSLGVTKHYLVYLPPS